MGLIDLLKDIPLSAVLKEKIATMENENGALQTENAILKDDKRQLETENKRLEEQIKSLTHKEDLHEVQQKMLILIANATDALSSQQLAADLALPEVKVEYHLEELIRNGYIRDRFGYPLHQKGREYLIKNGLI